MSDLGSRLQALRKQRGITQKQLAKRINKSLSAVSSYETGAQVPPLDVLISIAAALNVSLDYLAGFERREIIALDTLSEEQKALFRMLLTEFSSPSEESAHLTTLQRTILDQMFGLFYKRF